MPKDRRDVVALVHERYSEVYGTVKQTLLLFVVDVPGSVSSEELKEHISRWRQNTDGNDFSWHGLQLKRLPDLDQEAHEEFRRRKVAHVQWVRMVRGIEQREPMLLRIPTSLKRTLEEKAAAASLSLNEFCARELARAAQWWTSSEGWRRA